MGFNIGNVFEGAAKTAFGAFTGGVAGAAVEGLISSIGKGGSDKSSTQIGDLLRGEDIDGDGKADQNDEKIMAELEALIDKMGDDASIEKLQGKDLNKDGKVDEKDNKILSRVTDILNKKSEKNGNSDKGGGSIEGFLGRVAESFLGSAAEGILGGIGKAFGF